MTRALLHFDFDLLDENSSHDINSLAPGRKLYLLICCMPICSSIVDLSKSGNKTYSNYYCANSGIELTLTSSNRKVKLIGKQGDSLSKYYCKSSYESANVIFDFLPGISLLQSKQIDQPILCRF